MAIAPSAASNSEPSPKRRRISPPIPTELAAAAEDSSADELSREYHDVTPKILKPLPTHSLLSPALARRSSTHRQHPDGVRQSTEHHEDPDTSPDELDHTHLRPPRRTFRAPASASAPTSSPTSTPSSRPRSPIQRPASRASHASTVSSGDRRSRSTSVTPSEAISSSPIPADTPPSSQLSITSPSRQKLHYIPRLTIRGHARPVSCARFSPDGVYIASCSGDGTLRIHLTATGSLHHIHQSALAGLSTLAWSPNSSLLALGSDDLTIRLFSLPTLSVPSHSPLRTHHAAVLSLAFSPRGNILASGSVDEAVHLHCVRTGRLLKHLPAHSDPVTGVAFSHDGTLFVSCASDGVIRIWDTASGQCLRTFFGEETPAAGAVAFAPNSRFVVSWMLDSSALLWDYVGKAGGAGGARVVKTYEGHVNRGRSIAGCFGTYTLGSRAQGRRLLEDEMDVDGDGAGAGHRGGGAETEEKAETRAILITPSETNQILIHDVITKEILQTISVDDASPSNHSQPPHAISHVDADNAMFVDRDDLVKSEGGADRGTDPTQSRLPTQPQEQPPTQTQPPPQPQPQKQNQTPTLFHVDFHASPCPSSSSSAGGGRRGRGMLCSAGEDGTVRVWIESEIASADADARGFAGG
ncbi:MAG: WD domain protein [Chrysothrix sp. TS-e1954]|nr:MAG: WD domain protein [Chrysothrix sp. TS-e1954]